MEEKKKVRAKHVGFSGQREFCRNAGHTYIEKFSGDPVLMCNYPFPDPYHKKGVCRANTRTDMREIPEQTEADSVLDEAIIANDEEVLTHEGNGEVSDSEKVVNFGTFAEEAANKADHEEVYNSGLGEPDKVPTCDEVDKTTMADSGDGTKEDDAETAGAKEPAVGGEMIMPCPSND
jgi:hypothetical protein